MGLLRSCQAKLLHMKTPRPFMAFVLSHVAIVVVGNVGRLRPETVWLLDSCTTWLAVLTTTDGMLLRKEEERRWRRSPWPRRRCGATCT